MQISDAALHVFISYASRDSAAADSIVEALERRRLKCWIAPHDVKAGALYADAIVRTIGGAKAFVVVLSESSIASSHVGKEIERASSKKRRSSPGGRPRRWCVVTRTSTQSIWWPMQATRKVTAQIRHNHRISAA